VLVLCGAAAFAQTAVQGPLRIALVYVGPVGDGGWTYSHDVGRKAVVDKPATWDRPTASSAAPPATK
jgi:basic membrane lipoprotein Med (substrate-binding protein (PBP1-ABC) superfamily)